jgi:uncharacterized protein
VNLEVIISDVTFRDGLYLLRGRFYKPVGDSKFSAVAICHGYPGDTKNMDLAEELALNGVAVLVFYYEGAWGSEGVYRFSNLLSSTQAALSYLKSLEFVDSGRIGLISHSMGAIPLTNVMSKDESVKTGILMSPASDISKWLSKEVIDNIFVIFLEMAKGKLSLGSIDEYKQDMIEVARKYNPIDKISTIKDPLLFIVGSADNITHPDDVKAFYEKASPPKKLAMIDGADHGFSEHRIILIEKILEWLNENL